MESIGDQEAVIAFLRELWPNKPDPAAIQIWEKRTKRTSTFTDLPSAAAYAADQGQRCDVYVAVGLASKMAKPSTRRATAASVAAIPGLWADIDVNGGPDNKTGAAPSMDAAIELAGALIEPTILVNSGYGLQSWWLFEEPWIFASTEERERAAQLSIGFQAALRAEAKTRGFSIDSTHDLARLMRLPGTLNHKGGEPVAAATLDHDGAHHTLEALGAIAREHAPKATALNGGSVEIHLNGSKPDLTKIIELTDNEPEFFITWNHQPSTKSKGWSLSEYDMSIAGTLCASGFSDQEIADALRYHRQRYDDTSGKGERVDYLKRTINKARNVSGNAARDAEAAFEREDNIAQLTEIAEGATEEVAKPTVVALFTRIVGGPEIKELVQEGRDPANHRFKLVLANGEDVELGPIAGLFNQDRFRQSFAVATRHLSPKVPLKKWDKVVQALLYAATIHDGAEDTRSARVLAWVETYCEGSPSSDKDRACASKAPFAHEGYTYVSLDSLRQWVLKTRSERVDAIDLKLMLQMAGFERWTVAYGRPDGTRSSRSYWRIDSDTVNP